MAIEWGHRFKMLRIKWCQALSNTSKIEALSLVLPIPYAKSTQSVQVQLITMPSIQAIMIIRAKPSHAILTSKIPSISTPILKGTLPSENGVSMVKLCLNTLLSMPRVFLKIIETNLNSFLCIFWKVIRLLAKQLILWMNLYPIWLKN